MRPPPADDESAGKIPDGGASGGGAEAGGSDERAAEEEAIGASSPGRKSTRKGSGSRPRKTGGASRDASGEPAPVSGAGGGPVDPGSVSPTRRRRTPRKSAAETPEQRVAGIAPAEGPASGEPAGDAGAFGMAPSGKARGEDPKDGDTAAPRRPGALRRALASRRAPRVRTGLAAFFVVAALLGATASALALWSRDLVFDTDAYVRVVAPLAEDASVRASVAAFVAAKATQVTDLDGRLEAALPSTAKMTAPALARALQQYLEQEVEKFLGTTVARHLWVEVNRRAHRQLVGALRDQSGLITIGREDVTLDLVPLVAVALQRLEQKAPGLLGKDVTLPSIDPAAAPQDIRTFLQDALGRRLPADFGTVTLIQGDRGYELKQALKLFDRLVVLVVALTAALVVAALVVSVQRRRTALWLGLGALLAFAATRVLEAQIEKAAVAAVESSSGAAVARSLLTAAVSSLNAFLVWLAAAGAVVVVAAVLAGRPAWLQAMGRAFAQLFGVASDLPTPDTRAGRWIHGHLDVLRAGGVVAAVAALLFSSDSVTGAVVVVVALVVYELVLTAFAAGRPSQPADAGAEHVAEGAAASDAEGGADGQGASKT